MATTFLLEPIADKLGYSRRNGHNCVRCSDAFTNANVYTAAGWRETKLSGLCERCWDEVFAEEPEGDLSHLHWT